MRLIVRSSSWLNDTPLWRTALNSLIGIAINPKLMVPLQTGLGMRQRYTTAQPFGACASSGEHSAGDEVGSEGGEDGQVEQPGGRHHGRVLALAQRRLGDQHEADRRHCAGGPEPAEGPAPAVVDGAGPDADHPG